MASSIAHDGTVPAVAILRLDLTDFRNHATSRIETSSRMVVLTGPNGAGKTNVLEALSLLAPGRGLRRAPFAEMARLSGPGGWAMAVRLSGMKGPVNIGMAWRPAVKGSTREEPAGGGRTTGSESGRLIRMDGKPARGPGQLAEHVRVAWLTPAMDRLFTGPGSDRRRFFDRMAAALDPEHAVQAALLERLLRQRNRLLEEAGTDPRWLDAVEAGLAGAAVAVAAGRLALVAALHAGMKKVVTESDFPFPSARLRLEGWVEERLAEQPAVAVEDAFRAHLANMRRRDAAAGRTVDGPHRTDVLVAHAGKDQPARLCSTGEQKALLISLVLAQAASVREACGGAAPLLLLDEVAAHLDAERRQRLFATLGRLGGQVWMTGTDFALFAEAGEDVAHFHVEDGRVVPAASG
jgi:DNA replication and repair protein RecF